MRKFSAIFSAVAIFSAGLILAGCVTATSTGTGVDAEGRRAFLRYAGGEGPVYLAAINAPTNLGAGVGARAAAAATDSVIGIGVEFTADRAQASRPNYRIITLFDPEVSLSANQVCTADTRPMVAARYQDRTNLFMAFCARGEALAGAKVRGSKVVSADDPELTRMVRAGMVEMFPNPGVDGPGNPPVFGSLTFDGGTPRFRINPLTGIVGD
jgi:hypothetical protein